MSGPNVKLPSECLADAHTYNAVVIAVPEEHGAVVTCGAAQVQNQSICTVLLSTDIRNVIPDHLFLCGRVHPVCIFSYENNDNFKGFGERRYFSLTS